METKGYSCYFMGRKEYRKKKRMQLLSDKRLSTTSLLQEHGRIFFDMKPGLKETLTVAHGGIQAYKIIKLWPLLQTMYKLIKVWAFKKKKVIAFIVGFDSEDMINQNAPPGFKCDDKIIITNFGK